MDKNGKSTNQRSEGANPTRRTESRCAPILRRENLTSKDVADAMAALMSDVADGRMPPAHANAICRAAANLLRIAEIRFKYGATSSEYTPVLTGESEASLSA